MYRPALARLLTAGLGLLLAAGPARAAYELVQAPDPADPMGVHIYRLENGLEAHLTVNREEPRFYAEIAVRAGSKQDPAESTGLAHYLEHMLFKGTERLGTLDWAQERPHIERIADLYEQHFHETDPEKRAALYRQINEASVAASQFAVPNELDRLYDEMGSSMLNAHTWHEETVYKVGLPANRLAQWAAIEAERFRAPVFRLFQTELETVYEELNRWLDNKDAILRRAVSAQLYKTHPYGQQPTIGIPDQLKNPSLRNIGKYYDTYYVPNNMAIFISGDIDLEETIRTIDAHFSGWEAKPLPEARTWAEAPLQGREFVEEKHEGEEMVMLSFRTVPHSHPDAEALLLVDMILDNSAAGLINLNLNQQQRVRRAGSYPEQYNDYGAQTLFGIPKDGQTLEEVEQLLLEQLAIVKRGDFEDWLLPAIINDFKKNEKARLEDNTSRVAMMRGAWIGFTPWADAVRQIERMAKLTREDVVRVANTYFGDDYVAGFRRDAKHDVPNYPKPELAKIEIDPTRESAFGAGIRAMAVAPIEPVFMDPDKDFLKRSDPRGRDLYHVHNPINDIFNFSITVDFGTHEDDSIQVAAMLLNKAGTARFSMDELQKEWYKLGTSFNMAAGDNETVITLTGLDENFEPSVALLMELLRGPKTEPEVLAQMVGIILKQREDSKKQMEGLAAALVAYNRLGAESHFLRMLSTEALQALTVEQLFASIARLLDYKHAIGYTGSLPLEKVEAVLAAHYPLKDDLKDPPPHRLLTARRPEKTEIYFVEKEGAQANIRLEFGTHPFAESDRTAVDLYNNYFAGGMSGIVFQELREARALAYSAGAAYRQGYRAGAEDLMIGAIQTQNDKAVEAVAAFIDLLDNLPESAERFAIAKESLINQYRTGKIGFRSVIGVLRTWERYGLAVDPRARRFAELQEADMGLMQRFHADTVKAQPKLISVVGDPAKIDFEGLAAHGEIKRIAPEDIFVK
jgi:predicted Zn-dependent peptidase